MHGYCEVVRGIDLGGLEGWRVLAPPKICRKGSEYVLTTSKLLLDNSASFTSSRMKDLCQKWKVKLIFRGDLQAVRNRDC